MAAKMKEHKLYYVSTFQAFAIISDNTPMAKASHMAKLNGIRRYSASREKTHMAMGIETGKSEELRPVMQSSTHVIGQPA